MTEIFKVIGVAVICAILYVFIKQERQEYAVFVQLAGLTLIGLLSVRTLTQTVDSTLSVFNQSAAGTSAIRLLLKAVGLAIVAELAAGICRDNGASSLAAGVELAAKLAILTMALPMIQEAAALAKGLTA